MYDQQKWATRVQQLRIGPSPLDREVLLPELGQVDVIGAFLGIIRQLVNAHIYSNGLKK